MAKKSVKKEGDRKTITIRKSTHKKLILRKANDDYNNLSDLIEDLLNKK